MAKKGDSSSLKKKEAAAPVEGLPLFFRNPRALDSARHGKAAVRHDASYQFARQTNSVPINAIEFIEAAKHYPIVFTLGDAPMPAALVGLKRLNYYVGAEGWKEGSYIPAYVRQYPFVFFTQPNDEKFYLCIDESASQFLAEPAEGATALYSGDGKPADIIANAMQFCTAFYQHHQITRNFCADLAKHKLLVPYQSEARIAGGEKINLGGFQMIDEKALNALDDKTFLDFRKKGWLPFLYFAMASTSNWKQLLDLAAGAKEQDAA